MWGGRLLRIQFVTAANEGKSAIDDARREPLEIVASDPETAIEALRQHTPALSRSYTGADFGPSSVDETD